MILSHNSNRTLLNHRQNPDSVHKLYENNIFDDYIYIYLYILMFLLSNVKKINNLLVDMIVNKYKHLNNYQIIPIITERKKEIDQYISWHRRVQAPRDLAKHSLGIGRSGGVSLAHFDSKSKCFYRVLVNVMGKSSTQHRTNYFTHNLGNGLIPLVYTDRVYIT